MARKKNKAIPGQLSLFEYLDSIEEAEKILHAENEQENTQFEEVIYGNRRQNERLADNSSSSAQRGAGRNSSALELGSLFDSGTMGNEQPREIDGSLPRGQHSAYRESSLTGEHGTRSPLLGNGRQLDNTRHEQVGSSLSDGHKYRALENYTITAEDNLGKGGARTKFQDNINAIKTLYQINKEEREATNDEKKILVKYVGWGGLPQAFDKDNSSWAKEYNELKSLLIDTEYVQARRSTQDAHFTSETIIKGMYEGLTHLGVDKTDSPLKILEPAAGIGHFIGLQPKDLHAKFFAVEQDSITADISKLLYPKEKHLNKGFQDTDYSKNLFDITIGNPPFGQQKLYDRNFPQMSGFSIHNYFISKSMDLVKEGGVGAFVVSRHFMDSQNSAHRGYIDSHSHFLGAVRLPSNAFNENALADVTTDIVFFQKKTQEEKEQHIQRGHKSWLSLSTQTFEDKQTGGVQEGSINKYFAENPNQILGEMQFVRGQFADELKCVDTNNINLADEISKALEALPKNIFTHKASLENAIPKDSLLTDVLLSSYCKTLKIDSLLKINSDIYSKKIDEFGEAILIKEELRNKKEFQRISGMIDIRDSLRTLINAEKSDENNEIFIEDQRKVLNIQYDTFQRKFGFLNSTTNKGLFRFDPEASLIQSLEKDYDKGITQDQAEKTGREAKAPSATKSDIFFKRMLKPVELPTHADNTKDALAICLSEKGSVDFDRIASLVKKETEEVQQELKSENLVFLNPANEEWEIKDKYLTGNVKEKLSIAQREAENYPELYQHNVNALIEVIPEDIEAVDIGVRLGSSWLPAEDILDFIDEEIGYLRRYGSNLEYIPLLGKWEAKINIWDNAVNCELWGTKDYPADQLIQAILTNKPIKVEREIGRDPQTNKPIKEIEQEATAVAMRKAKGIEQAFSDWIWKDDTRRERLARVYNDRFNTHVVPKYDGSHIELVNASDTIKLRPHQKNAVWRAMQEGTALFDHVVGAGKTFAATAMVKESKRMGLFNKPMIVVPNSLVYQWRDEFYDLYPDANILVATKEDFLKQNRERFFSRVATNDWDAVIVAHSSFKKIDMPKQVEQEILEEQLEATFSALETLKENGGSRATVKQLEKQKEKITERYEALLAGAGNKDKSVDFSDLGIDALIVDEAHEFKNLNFTTTMNVSGMGNVAGSAKALDLFIKCRYLQRENEGKGVYFLTGTPISNSISEVFTMQRYLQFDELSKKGLEFFDSWASTFAKVSSDWELDSTGVNYKLKSRFSKFDNVPELLSMYRSFADVVTKDDIENQLKLAGLPPNTPPLLSGKPISHIVERSGDQAVYMNEIIDRMENLPSDPSIDNPLKITNDARKAGLDYRLIDPDAEDFGGTKINACADRIYSIWQDSAEDKGTQLVFCDLSTPKGSSKTSNKSPTLNFVDDDFSEKDDKDSATNEISMDELLSFQSNNNFSVYDGLKTKLIAKGIPPHEIAFIHDANTDQRKSKLFGDVKSGNVRVLIGSTAKMGAGMNVQDRLVAAHHLDAPWRPSDLEQRNGRIIRQGNQLYNRNPENFKVGIYYYATKQTYDARMWQTIEYKAAAIEQFRKGDLLQRKIDDVRSEAATAAEMKAAASGNPLILLEVNIANELKNLEALSTEHARSKHRLYNRIQHLEKAGERIEAEQAIYNKNLELRDKNTVIHKENDKEKIVVELYSSGKIYTKENSKDIENIIKSAVKDTVISQKMSEASIGKYRGFDISMKKTFHNADHGFYFILEGNETKYMPANLKYSISEDFSLSGFFQRIDNFLEKGIEERYTNEVAISKREQAELPNARLAYEKEFEQKDELNLARENHSQVIHELQKMKDNTGYISDWQAMTLEEYKKKQDSPYSFEIKESGSPIISLNETSSNAETQSMHRYPPIENAFKNKVILPEQVVHKERGSRLRMR